jgi:hypothetical protein
MGMHTMPLKILLRKKEKYSGPQWSGGGAKSVQYI